MSATTTVPLTLPAHTSLFSGEFPGGHGVRDNTGFHVEDRVTMLAEVFKARGYRTGGFVGAFVLDSRWGIAQGFDEYFDDFDLSEDTGPGLDSIQRPGNEVVDKALAWLGRCIPLAETLGLHDVLSDALDTEACVRCNHGGDWYPLMRRSLNVATQHDLHAHVGRAYANLTGLLQSDGRYDEALEAARDGLAYSEEHDVGTYSRCIRGGYAEVLDILGRWDDADTVLGDLLGMASSPGNRISAIAFLKAFSITSADVVPAAIATPGGSSTRGATCTR